MKSKLLISPEATTNNVNSLLALVDYQLNKKNGDIEDYVLRQHASTLNEIKTKIARLWERMGNNPNLADAQRMNKLNALMSAIQRDIIKLTKTDIQILIKELKEVHTLSYDLSNNAFKQGLQLDLTFASLTPESIKAAVMNQYEKIKWNKSLVEHSGQYIADIREEITKGLIKGDTYTEIAANITSRANINASKVMRIVRTETHRVNNEGRLETFDRVKEAGDALGFKVKRIWKAIHDNRTRVSHNHLDGKPENNDGIFITELGSELKAPSVSAGNALAKDVINCRCTTLIKITNL